MISAVFVAGRLGEKIAPLGRYVEIDRVLPGPTGHYGVDKVPVFTYSGEGCLFMKAPIGSFISFKGHIETEFGKIELDCHTSHYDVNENCVEVKYSLIQGNEEQKFHFVLYINKEETYAVN